jgi:hypothetical protein
MGKPKPKRAIPRVGAGRATTPIDLFLIAGIPHPLNLRIEESLRNIAGISAKVVTVSSVSHDGQLYRKATVQSLLRSAGQFAVKRLGSQAADAPPSPRRIAIFYVPASDDDLLLRAFDYFIFPVPLRELAEFDELGHQKRHDRNACERAVAAAFEMYNRELVTLIQPRIEGRRPTEQLLLPPQNFHLQHQAIGSFFLELTRRARSWGDAALAEVKSEVFDHEQLPKFLRPQERLAMFRDARNVIFPCARATQLHGRLPELEPSSEVKLFQDFLRTTYRFGAPLPGGFHHDVQLEWGDEFDRMTFDCSREGRIQVSGSHANIYPNDFIRAANSAQI